MRWLVVASLLVVSANAHADSNGYFIAEGFGGASYRGELSRYDGAPRLQVGFDIRRGPWTVEIFGAGTIPDFGYIDCYGAECAYAAKPVASLAIFGVDLKERWRVLTLRHHNTTRPYEHTGVFFALHGGPRWIEGGDAIEGYRGMGLGAGAAVEGDIWVIGYYLDFGLDVMRLDGPDDTLHGSTPYVMFGGKMGWL